MAPGKNETRWVFLDRDGVLVGDRMHVYRIGDLKILPNVAEGLKKMQSLGFKFIVVTNQAGVARGLFTIHDAKQFNDVLLSRLERKGIHIEKVYLCPHHPDFTGACGCRKPKTGLAEEAGRDFRINLKESIFVGDKDSDTEFGKNCGGVTFRITCNQYENAVKADYEAKDLLGVADILESNGEG